MLTVLLRLHAPHFSSLAGELRLFHLTAHYNFKLNKFTVPSFLKNCSSRLDISHGKRIHAIIFQLGLHSDLYIASSLIVLYSKCGHLSDANLVFDQMPQRDATVWNSMVGGYFHQQHYHEGLAYLRQMQLAGLRPDCHSLTILLKACSDGGLGLEQGEQVHGFLVRNALDHDTFALTALMHAYSRTGKVSRACKVFDGVFDKSISMWNALISGLCYNGLWDRSLELFVLMVFEGFEVQSETASCVLVACTMLDASGFGQGVHCCAIKMGFDLDSYVCSSLISLYANVGSMVEAFRLFDSVPSKEVQLWNSMISAFFSNSCASEALDAYNQMRASNVKPDSITITNVISACSMVGHWKFGRKIHGLLIKMPELSTIAVQSSLISMYMRIGDVHDGIILFNSVKEWDVVLLSSMITGFCQNKHYNHALQMFNQFCAEGFIPDSVIIASILSACTTMDWLQLGYEIHSLAIKNGTICDPFVASALICMYSKCGLPLSAASVFCAIAKKNLVVWNSLISGYSHNGLLDESINAFAGIAQNGLLPDSVSITSVLVSVSIFAALGKGKMIHGYLVRNGIFCDEIVGNSFIDMYMKCGCLRYAQLIFDRLTVRNLVTWNTMIAGYGSHGHCLKAINLFDEMQQLKIIPDGTSFLSLISSCSHSGLVEEGRKLFDSMINCYRIKPAMEHYANMVDLLGRAGCLDEAYCFVKDMPVEPDQRIWLCFLSACRSHRVLHLGEIASGRLIKAKPQESGSYTQVLNFYGEMGLREKAASLRVQMKEAGMPKNPGCSWIEVVDKVQVFNSGDSSSALTTEIHASLRSLKRNMKLVEGFESL
ncbi:pentatricopeptide repeat-containing protein At2g40720 [Dendrobium catenatum]|uniref:Pentatricopeptide repeat-containing protein n=1 Tax=Dendrobium catenatum TaxID=906689 RepID=A0A2I0WFP8_9ASPA|nr:pentatricopeptide repeat-containing protein At2g40720 [Dendrobium catenatum]PKU74480.1 Pentatricopeptide repeat-containing protein [Dendrobium catenatum]